MSYLLTPVAFDPVSSYKTNIFLQCFLIRIPRLIFQFSEQRLHKSSSFCKNLHGITLSWQLRYVLFCLLTCLLTIPLRFLRLRFVLIVLGFNDTSTLEGHFVSSPREREKRYRRESRGDERKGQGRKRNRNESEETEEIKTFPLYPYPLQG